MLCKNNYIKEESLRLPRNYSAMNYFNRKITNHQGFVALKNMHIQSNIMMWTAFICSHIHHW